MSIGTRTFPPVGAGDISVAIAAKRGLDATDVARALHAAIEAGLDVFDVSAEEKAERVVGDTIRSLRVRDRVIAAFRIPAIAERLGVPTRDTLLERLPPAYLQQRVESALRTSRLDVLPLAQLGTRAFYRTSKAWPEVVDTCARLVREGKVLEWGAYVDAVEDDTPDLVQEPWLASLNVPFNLCERAAGTVIAAASGAGRLPAPPPAPPPRPTGLILTPFDIIPREPEQPAVLAPVHARRIPVLARRPLAGGTLAGTIGPGAKQRIHDDRRLSDAELERIAVGVAKLARFVKQTPPAALSCDAARAQLERNARPREIHIQTLAELALGYVLATGAIALPRLHRPEHVTAALLLAHSPPLPPDLVEELDN